MVKNFTPLKFWYACRDCNTELETFTEEGKWLNGYVCSYCGSINTYFIGWSDDD